MADKKDAYLPFAYVSPLEKMRQYSSSEMDFTCKTNRGGGKSLQQMEAVLLSCPTDLEIQGATFCSVAQRSWK